MKVEIDITKALIGDMNWNTICEIFKIPLEQRYESWVPGAIEERIRTYVTGYIARKSIMERENQAAFKIPNNPPLPEITPVLEDPKKIDK